MKRIIIAVLAAWVASVVWATGASAQPVAKQTQAFTAVRTVDGAATAYDAAKGTVATSPTVADRAAGRRAVAVASLAAAYQHLENTVTQCVRETNEAARAGFFWQPPVYLVQNTRYSPTDNFVVIAYPTPSGAEHRWARYYECHYVGADSSDGGVAVAGRFVRMNPPWTVQLY
jgi:hypothetical protein